VASTIEIGVGELQLPPPFVSGDAIYDGRSLCLRVKSAVPIKIVEIQGSKRFIESFGGSMPTGFRIRWFADDKHVPKEMMDDIAGLNLANFRWGCDLPVSPQASTIISIPVTTRPPKDRTRGTLDVVYERRKLFGLIRERTFFRFLLNMEALAKGAQL
jgi:hypothetical protein